MSNDFIQNAVNALYQSNELMALKAENARLKAEVERLTKAGDNMARVCHGIYGGLPLWEEWNKAKEGKQP